MRELTAAGTDARVRAVVREEFGVGDGALEPDVPLADLLIDSLALVELVMVLEDTFDVGIGDGDLAELRTVGDLCAAVRRRVTPTTSSGLAPKGSLKVSRPAFEVHP